MGWLGQPLAHHLATLGYRIKGSVTSLEKASGLQQRGFYAYSMLLTENGLQGEYRAFLNGIDTLIIMIPPGLRRHSGSDYVLKMTYLLEAIEAASIAQVILVSSTSVYDDAQGKVTERDKPKPSTIAGKQLFQVEQLFFNSEGFQTSIVRFGGLYGGSRQPVRYLAGRENLSGGNAPVNLIHRDDCIGILSEIIRQNAFGHIFNAVIPEHPVKSNYYKKAALELDLIPPSYSEEIEEDEIYKQVDSENLKRVLNYTFRHTQL